MSAPAGVTQTVKQTGYKKMTFSEKLHTIMAALDIRNAELARAAGLDPAVVSRLKNGRRSAVPGGPLMRKLVGGICLLAEGSANTPKLLALCSGDQALPLPEALNIWLCDGMVSGSSKKAHATKKSRIEFGSRLTAVMDLLDISNILLAKKLNVDASLISRYKSGLRAPPDGGAFIEQLCRYIVWKADAQQQTAALRHIVNAGTDSEPEELYAAVRTWLTVYADPEADRLAVSRMLERIENLSDTAGAGAPAQKPQVPETVLSDDRGCYYGKTGLREAALRFLAHAAQKSGPGELMLYSDRSMEWMTDNPVFVKRWGALMRAVLSGGTRIRIIHNIGRTNAEMLAAISLWLPLYATGLVEPYYCRDELGGRFQHTLFVSGTDAVIGSAVRGSSDVFYLYMREPAILSCCKSQYGALLKKSAPIVKTYTADAHSACLDETKRFFEGTACVSVFAPSPSVLTMPEELFKSLLVRHDLPASEMDGLLREHAELRAGFLNALARRSFTEITPVSAAFRSDVCVNLGLFQSGLRIDYTQEAYTRHLSAIRDLLRSEPNYHLKPLGAAPFRNLEILQKANSETLVSILGDPSVAFEMRTALMTAAFRSFLEELENKALTAGRSETINLLEQIIRK
jgi:transcriptional regulator with XRE-family HTH domain